MLGLIKIHIVNPKSVQTSYSFPINPNTSGLQARHMSNSNQGVLRMPQTQVQGFHKQKYISKL